MRQALILVATALWMVAGGQVYAQNPIAEVPVDRRAPGKAGAPIDINLNP